MAIEKSMLSTHKNALTYFNFEVEKLIERAGNRQIIIFGASIRGIFLYREIIRRGRKIAYLVDSDTSKHQDSDPKIVDPLELLYENSDEIFIIISAMHSNSILNVLEGYGINKESNIETFFSITEYPKNEESSLIDFMLGYNRSTTLTGFETLQSIDQASQLNIIILGGSTTDPTYSETGSSRTGSWPRTLHELLCEQNIPHKIYNGGIHGYTSAQELLKLIRDCLGLKPDIIISLDGINDNSNFYWHQGKHPKTHTYFSEISKLINSIIANETKQKSAREITYGIPSMEQPPKQEWLDNQKMMHAICKTFGIRYINFIQPFGTHDLEYLASIKDDYAWFWMIWNILNDLPRVEKGGCSKEIFDTTFESEINSPNEENPYHFLKSIQESSTEFDFIIDISDVFYGQPGVFIDNCHLRNEGNRILGKRIFNELVDRTII